MPTLLIGEPVPPALGASIRAALPPGRTLDVVALLALDDHTMHAVRRSHGAGAPTR